MTMTPRLKINMAVSAVLAFALVFLLYGDELERRLGRYLLTYAVAWWGTILALLFATFKAIRVLTITKVIVVGIVLGYFSITLAHIISVVLDVSQLRSHPSSISLVPAIVIPFMMAYIGLKGWAFSILFVALNLLLNRYFGRQ